MTKKIRLNKYLSLCGIGSRRKCDQYIKEGKISVNGKINRQMGLQIDEKDTILYEGKKVSPEKITYVVLNKPIEVVTTLEDPEGRATVAEYFEKLPFIKPVGRLDYNTSGVLILTNDGDLHYRLTHPKFQIAKLYKVVAKGIVKEDIKEQIQRGIRMEDGKVARGSVKNIKYNKETTEVLLELREGLNREIRRMFDTLGYKILQLDRINFAGIEKKGLKVGEWRHLNRNEIALLKKY